MKAIGGTWFMVAAAAITAAATVALAACGSDGGDASPESSGGETVSVQEIGDAGDVLVDSRGAALYTPEEEARGKILCTGGCEAIWTPLLAKSGQPSASDDVGGTLGTVKRPDGSEQVTFDGDPLYTFTEEGPGEVTGDGLVDSFGGQRFTWHVAPPAGTASGDSTTTTSPDSGGYEAY